MRNPFRRETRAASSYTDTLLGLIQAGISGNTADASQVAAAEFGISYLARAFASALVAPEVPALTPPVLAAIGRQLMTRGEWAAVIDVDDGIVLRPAAHWEIDGQADERTWVYTLDLPAPSGEFEEVKMRSAGVVHIRVNEAVDAPWKGRSPLQTAGLSARLLAHLETRTGEEASSRSGFLMSIPQLSEEKLTALRSDLKGLKGDTALVESASTDYGKSTDRRGSAEYGITRFGARFPAENIELRRDVAAHVLGAMGCPTVLLNGPAQRRRRDFHPRGLPPGADRLDTAIGPDRIFGAHAEVGQGDCP